MHSSPALHSPTCGHRRRRHGDGRFGHTGTIESTQAIVLDHGDGAVWALTVAGPFPDDTPRIQGFVNRAFEAAGFIAG